ncbi:MAG: hypothetical protein QNJ87_08830 [Gammaproteobacteria bacterium]|nr:hypothetical protein [Gammaproteobacteria bacterium]
MAGDVLQLYNRTESGDTAKNAFAGAGAGALVGFAAGAVARVAFCQMAECSEAFAPLVVSSSGVASAIIGTATGAATGAHVDTRAQVEMAPAHRYEVNKVLPSLQDDHFTRTVLERRILRLPQQQNPNICYAPVVKDRERFRLRDPLEAGEPYTAVNLGLSELRVLLAGKQADDPRVRLSVRTQWELTKYDVSSNSNIAWDIFSATYKSKRRPLSEWLANYGALLKSHANEGLEQSFTDALSELQSNAKKEDHPVLTTGSSF